MQSLKPAAIRSVKSFSPGKFGSGTNAPVVNDTNFTDARPTIGGSNDTFNPGGATAAGVLPGGPPKYINPPGRKTNSFAPKGETNKRLP